MKGKSEPDLSNAKTGDLGNVTKKKSNNDLSELNETKATKKPKAENSKPTSKLFQFPQFFSNVIFGRKNDDENYEKVKENEHSKKSHALERENYFIILACIVAIIAWLFTCLIRAFQYYVLGHYVNILGISSIQLLLYAGTFVLVGHRILGAVAGLIIRFILRHSLENNGKYDIHIGWISFRGIVDRNEIVIHNVVWRNPPAFYKTPYLLHLKEVRITLLTKHIYTYLRHFDSEVIRIDEILIDNLEIFIEKSDNKKLENPLNLYCAMDKIETANENGTNNTKGVQSKESFLEKFVLNIIEAIKKKLAVVPSMGLSSITSSMTSPTKPYDKDDTTTSDNGYRKRNGSNPTIHDSAESSSHHSNSNSSSSRRKFFNFFHSSHDTHSNNTTTTTAQTPHDHNTQTVSSSSSSHGGHITEVKIPPRPETTIKDQSMNTATNSNTSPSNNNQPDISTHSTTTSISTSTHGHPNETHVSVKRSSSFTMSKLFHFNGSPTKSNKKELHTDNNNTTTTTGTTSSSATVSGTTSNNGATGNSINTTDSMNKKDISTNVNNNTTTKEKKDVSTVSKGDKTSENKSGNKDSNTKENKENNIKEKDKNNTTNNNNNNNNNNNDKSYIDLHYIDIRRILLFKIVVHPLDFLSGSHMSDSELSDLKIPYIYIDHTQLTSNPQTIGQSRRPITISKLIYRLVDIFATKFLAFNSTAIPVLLASSAANQTLTAANQTFSAITKLGGINNTTTSTTTNKSNDNLLKS